MKDTDVVTVKDLKEMLSISIEVNDADYSSYSKTVSVKLMFNGEEISYQCDSFSIEDS